MMNKMRYGLMTVIFGVGIAVAANAFGSEEKHEGMEQGSHTKEMSHGGHKGVEIHNSDVEGHQFAYELIDIMGKMTETEGVDMTKIKSHHMMVYITYPDGEVVAHAKVGFKIVGPDGNEQKVMAMAMAGGYGADVDFKAAGSYKIATKAVYGDNKLIDGFSYEVK